MAYIESGPRVGRSQGASIFWGLVSVFFAAAACFYFWKSHENEINAIKFRDEVLNLQNENDTLNAEKEKLQAAMSDSAGQMKTREEFLNEKEAKLAAQETHLESLGMKASAPTQPKGPAPIPQSPATTPKKFADEIHKLGQIDGADTTTRGGRPVARIPSTSFFAPGDAALKPDGKALLEQIGQALAGQSDDFELRIEAYTDTDAESDASDAAKTDKGKKDSSGKGESASKPHYANGWELTAARAAAIERYYRDESSLTFENVLIVARGDSLPIVTSGKDRSKNRRVEVSLAPLPAAFHADVDPLAPPPDAPAKKAKSN